MKYVAAFIVGALFSAAWMHWQFSQDVMQPKEKSQEHRLSEEDFKEYLQLKSDSEKLAKAEEIFSKIIVLMLYDIGIKVSKPVQEAFPPKQFNALADKPSERLESIVQVNDVKKVDVANHSVPSLIESTVKPEEISDAKDADQYMQEQTVDIAKLSTTQFQSLGGGALPALDLLEGQFEGFLRPINGGEEIRIELDLQIRERRSPPAGQYALRMYKGGNLFSNSRGSGSLKDFMTETNRPSLWIEEGGKDYRFQLFYFRRLQVWKANAYIKSNSGQWRLYSRFDLNKL